MLAIVSCISFVVASELSVCWKMQQLTFIVLFFYGGTLYHTIKMTGDPLPRAFMNTPAIDSDRSQTSPLSGRIIFSPHTAQSMITALAVLIDQGGLALARMTASKKVGVTSYLVNSIHGPCSEFSAEKSNFIGWKLLDTLWIHFLCDIASHKVVLYASGKWELRSTSHNEFI